jgi:uncharacterized protein YdhG (YjbR/CyaY superfamily)
MELKTIDDYISICPKEIKEILEKVRQTIHNAAPDAIEKISYQMPTFYQDGNLIHFAAFKNHLGIYPGPEVIEAMVKELKNYKTSKGTIQFQYNKPIPYNLIEKIVKYNLKHINKKSGY